MSIAPRPLFGGDAESPAAPSGRRTAAAPQRIDWGRLLLWGLCIFLFSSPFTFTLIGQNPAVSVQRNLATMRQADNSQMLLYLVRFAVLGVAVAFALRRWRTASRGWVHLAALAPFTAWATLSIFWSDDMATTAHSVISLVVLIAAAYLMAVTLPPRVMAGAVLVAALLMALASLGQALVLPVYGIHQTNDASQAVHAGAWRGVYMHKNFLGQVAAIFAAAIVWIRPEVAPAWLKWATFALLLLLIKLSTSATAVVIVPITVVLVWTVLMASPRRRAQILLATLPLLLIAYLSVNLLLSTLGRDMTFSGRTIVWQVAWDSFLASPLAGQGFVSLTYGDFSYNLMRTTGLFDPHNAFFDIALGTGAVGLILFVGAVAAACRAGRLLYLRGGDDAQAALALFSLLIGWLIGGFTEASDRPFSAMGGLGLFALVALLSLPRGMASPVRRERESPAMAMMRATAARNAG